MFPTHVSSLATSPTLTKPGGSDQSEAEERNKELQTGIKITEKQYAILKNFKKELKIPEIGVPQDTGIKDDTTLFRFLSGKKWDISDALEQYRAMLKWREDMKVDDIFKWEEDNMDKCKAIKDLYPSEHYGFDREGRPLLVHRIGLIPAETFAERVDRNVFKKYHIAKFERMLNVCRSQSKKLKKPIYQITVIVDAQGLSFGHRHYKPFFTASSSIDKQNYPEFLSSVTVINAPWVLPTIYGLVSHLIDPNTRNKVTFFQDDYGDTLRKKIDMKEIPKDFGGACEKELPVPIVSTKNEEGLETETISMMSSWEVTKRCKDPKGGRFAWVFKLEAYDINFRVEFKGKDDKDFKVIQSLEQVKKHEGEHDFKTPGEIKLVFDNTYSYLTSKTVQYLIALHNNASDEDGFGVSTRKSTTGTKKE